jgi:hypothetical protein
MAELHTTSVDDWVGWLDATTYKKSLTRLRL